MMHVHRTDLLTIESTSASKPSLLSSFWSINVQVQNNERLEFDTKTCSQFSLPEVAQSESPNGQKPTRSVSVTDLNTQYDTAPPPALQPLNPKAQPPTMSKEPASCRVADWITNLDLNK